MRVGDQVVFVGYRYLHPEVPAVFQVGDLGTVAAALPDGELRLCGLTSNAEVLWWRSDTVFAEEVVRLNNAPVITLASLNGERR